LRRVREFAAETLAPDSIHFPDDISLIIWTIHRKCRDQPLSRKHTLKLLLDRNQERLQLDSSQLGVNLDGIFAVLPPLENFLIVVPVRREHHCQPRA